MEEVRVYLPIVIALAALGWNILLVRMGARKAELDKLGARIDEVESDLDQHRTDGSASRGALSERLGKVEMRLTHMPDKDTVHGLAISVTEIRGDIRTQGETLKAVAATASRVEEFLLDQSKK